ncbi:MAG: dephospho-CoA kinase [Flavobacteriales bacterium]
MKIIGITGGIGSGKSTIAKVFMSIGYPVYNSDTRAKELINSNEKLINSIKLSFGDDLYNSQGLDRKKMASIVFNNPEKLELLNFIIHPTVGKDFEKWIDLQNTSFILKEAAILFETGIYKSLHKTILVSAPQETRIERVIKRDNTNQEEVLSRMNNQWSEEKKTELADYVIDNSGNKLVIPQVLEIIKQILK